jgi:hypothetical protein
LFNRGVRYNGGNGVISFVTQNWLEVLQTVGIIAGLFSSAYTIRKEADVRRIQNLFTLTKNHREIWSQFVDRPELARVLTPAPDLNEKPVTEAERFFVLFLILHLASSFAATKHGMYFAETGLREDVANFFNLPIPSAVWEEMKIYQDSNFVRFVEEACLDQK